MVNDIPTFPRVIAFSTHVIVIEIHTIAWVIAIRCSMLGSSIVNGDGSADCGVSVTTWVMLEIFIMSPEIGPMSG
ncbi:hypothetical protein B4907_21675 [Yersinia kristensenii]|nr:hypothetical protein B4907_21675 [Yersinia kristensenii]